VKICIKCGKEKNIENFSFLKSTQKYNNACIECVSVYQKSYNQNYHQNNKDELNAISKEYYKNNTDTIKIRVKKYIANNQKDIKNYNKEYQKSKRKSDPSFRLRGIVSTRVGQALRAIGKSKNSKSTLNYLPYTMQDLKDHLEKQFEPWMTWDNHGTHNIKEYDENNSATWKWNIDHIIPQSKLPYTSMEEDNFKQCWALSNLRPLLAKENIKKGAK
jgi:hypothetical protein